MVSVGDTFGNLTVLENIGEKRISSLSKHDTTHYLCQCHCGNVLEVSEPNLEYNLVKSCGCVKNRKI